MNDAYQRARTELPRARKLSPPRAADGLGRCWPDHRSHYAIEGHEGHFGWVGTATADNIADGPQEGQVFARTGRGSVGCPTVFVKLAP